ncbi:hypothetical protein NC653_023067 [Populus alba x Populus x berolinensis]|uniref:Uncharacterized protein n=1 Tax=Populus alba x Populus x berolinensis TaxID=444605 RepID=A0AAD6MGK5_9ROSI|nr:hypothetical protein NC653_023067 [Populus alba x Populus x berolinensis]
MTAFPPTTSLIYPYFKHTGHHFNQKRKLSDYILCELCLGIQCAIQIPKYERLQVCCLFQTPSR